MVGFMPILSGTLSADFGSMQKIVSLTPTGSSAVVTFTNIPQIYKDLILIIHGVNALGGGNAIMILDNINGAQTTNRSRTVLVGSGGGSSSSSRTTNSSSITIINSSLAANVPVAAEIHIFNYADASQNKTVLFQASNDKNGSGSVEIGAGIISSTSAITAFSISSAVAGSYWTNNSIFSLYGIRASA